MKRLAPPNAPPAVRDETDYSVATITQDGVREGILNALQGHVGIVAEMRGHIPRTKGRIGAKDGYKIAQALYQSEVGMTVGLEALKGAERQGKSVAQGGYGFEVVIRPPVGMDGVTGVRVEQRADGAITMAPVRAEPAGAVPDSGRGETVGKERSHHQVVVEGDFESSAPGAGVA